MRFSIFTLLFIVSLFVVSQASAQNCNPPPIVANTSAANIFSPGQETVLGDLIMQSMAGDMRLIRDDELSGYVNRLGERLVRHLPQTGLTFRFHIVDIPEANAFNIPGGHVFLSRKLIGFAANEDELAGVMAHELGHAAVHHGAVDMTETFRRVLNVTAMGNDKDVADKFNLLIENLRTKRASRRRGHENEQQLEADRIGLFAMVAAGYDPNAFTTFFDRLTESEGKTGNWFTDIFGGIRPEQKRLREMIKLTNQLPAACRDKRADTGSEPFLQWQAKVVTARDKWREEKLPGLVWRRELSPKLTSDVKHLSFSPDGKYLLSQDDFAITVLSREPLKVLFQVPAENAQPAFFTGDSREIVILTDELRFERWNVETKQAVTVRELVVRRDCWESRLSPDGNYLACVDMALKLSIVDTNTGRKLFQTKEIYQLSGLEYYLWLAGSGRSSDETGLFRIEFSTDSRHVVVSRSDRFRFKVIIDLMTVASSENGAIAVELASGKKVSVGSDFVKLAARPYIFVSADTILANGSDLNSGGLFSFPTGKTVRKFPFGAKEIKRTQHSDYVLLKPISNAKVGVFSLSKNAVHTGIFKADAAMWSDIVALEAASGKIYLQKVVYNEKTVRFDSTEIANVDVPVSSIGRLRAAGVSDDFRWFVMSSRSRGGFWDLASGERKMFVRGFENALVAGSGAAVVDFPRFGNVDRSLVLMNAKDASSTIVQDLSGGYSRQHGRFLLTRTSLKPQKEPEKPKGADEGLEALDIERAAILQRDVRLDVVDIVSKQTVWTREFNGALPRFSFDEYSGRILFFWRPSDTSVKSLSAVEPQIREKLDKLGDRENDYVVEVVDSFEKKTIGVVPIETGKGSFSVGGGASERDWLLLYDSEGRTLVYSIGSGELRQRFFGRNAALNPSSNLVLVESWPGEISVYDLESGESRANFVVAGSVSFARFDLKGQRLFVLSDNQTAYAFDLTKALAVKP